MQTNYLLAKKTKFTKNIKIQAKNLKKKEERKQKR
jgi:hypothetical protein